jgi:hypothetical protein
LWQLARSAAPIATYLGRIRASIRDFAPDVLHTNGLKMHLLGARTGRAPKLVWHLHDYLSPRPISARLLRRSRLRCAAVVANSASVADDVRQTIGDGVTVFTVRNAVDLIGSIRSETE